MNKKHLTLLTLIIIVCTSSLIAQNKLEFGVNGGLNIATQALTPAVTAPSTLSPVASFHIGGQALYPFNEHFGIETELLFTGCGSKITDGTVVIKDKIYNLELPLDAVYKFKLNSGAILVNAGIFFSYSIAGNENISGSPAYAGTKGQGYTMQFVNGNYSIPFGNNLNSAARSFDMGFNLGAGYEWKQFQFRLQYDWGLRNLVPQPAGYANNDKTYDRVFEITFAYILGKGEKK